MVKGIIHLPTSRPTKTRIERIAQIEYYSVIPGDSPLMDVYARNVRTSDEYWWRNLPASYENALHRALYKLELLKLVAACTDVDRNHHVSALKYLIYMDNILDRVWNEAGSASEEDEMSSNWRSGTLDRWIIIESNVQRHGDMEIETWLEEMNISDQQLFDMDALQIDWSTYEVQMSAWLSGASFYWDIDRFKQRWGSDLELVCRYVAAFYDGDDEAALEIQDTVKGRIATLEHLKEV